MGFNEAPVVSTGDPDFDPTDGQNRAGVSGAQQPQPSSTPPRTRQSDDARLTDKASRLGFEDDVAPLDEPGKSGPQPSAPKTQLSLMPQEFGNPEDALNAWLENELTLRGVTSGPLFQRILKDYLDMKNLVRTGDITLADVNKLIAEQGQGEETPKPEDVFTPLTQDDIGELLDFVISHEKSNFSIPPEEFIIEQMNLILQEAANPEYNLNTDQLAYIFATAHWESHWGYFDLEVADGSGYGDLEGLGNSSAAEGELYKGRGFVQLTGKFNYETFMDIMGIDLINNPNLAYTPENAAFIIVYGMVNGNFGDPLSDFETETGFDFEDARDSVNRADLTDNRDAIAKMAEEYSIFFNLLCRAGLLPNAIQCVNRE
ncbi:MAG: hypothetical protein IH859_09480 [Chloroflexi bacterium]|nr:hypothetical protein [Chloroflexota bacterium]